MVKCRPSKVVQVDKEDPRDHFEGLFLGWCYLLKIIFKTDGTESKAHAWERRRVHPRANRLSLDKDRFGLSIQRKSSVWKINICRKDVSDGQKS